MVKGKFYYGPVGVGKTTKMKKDRDAMDSEGKVWLKARSIARVGQEEGLTGMARLACCGAHLFIDDLGHEALTVSHFGTVFNPVSEFIQAYYDNRQEWPKAEFTIHFTSNLSLEELRNRYGDFIFDRLIEMCEWKYVEGESFRK